MRLVPSCRIRSHTRSTRPMVRFSVTVPDTVVRFVYRSTERMLLFLKQIDSSFSVLLSLSRMPHSLSDVW